MDFSVPLWTAVVAGCVCGALGAWVVQDALEVKREMKRLTGNTREETLNRLRAHIVVMRREYAIKSYDRFTIEMSEAVDKLEETMKRLETEEWEAVR